MATDQSSKVREMIAEKKRAVEDASRTKRDAIHRVRKFFGADDVEPGDIDIAGAQKLFDDAQRKRRGGSGKTPNEITGAAANF